MKTVVLDARKNTTVLNAYEEKEIIKAEERNSKKVTIKAEKNIKPTQFH